MYCCNNEECESFVCEMRALVESIMNCEDKEKLKSLIQENHEKIELLLSLEGENEGKENFKKRIKMQKRDKKERMMAGPIFSCSCLLNEKIKEMKKGCLCFLLLLSNESMSRKVVNHKSLRRENRKQKYNDETFEEFHF